MDNSLLLLIENSENNKLNIKKNNNMIMYYIIGIGLNILLFINYNNIYINLLIFILFYSILCLYLILEKKILCNEKINILLFILVLTFIYDLLNVFDYNKRSINFIFININLICIKTLIIYNL